jgi:hypothetical protein
MSDNLDKYLPEFNEDDIRSRLANFTREQLTDMLVYAYKEKRVIAKYADEQLKKLDRIEKIVVEPSNLVKMPGIPTAEDIRRMMEDED